MLLWSFFLVLLVTLVQQSSAINIRTICRGLPYGTLLPNPEDCASYYLCQPGAKLVDCEHGLHFNRINHVCDWPSQAKCQLEGSDQASEMEMDEEVLVESIAEKICVGHPSGTLLPNPKDCASYYSCHSGPQLVYCDYGLHFDRIEKVCNWPARADCHLEDLKHDLLTKDKSKLEQLDTVDEKLVADDTSIDNSLKPLSVLGYVAKPIHTQFSKELISKIPGNSQTANKEASKPSVENEVPHKVGVLSEKDSILGVKVPALVAPVVTPNVLKEQTIKKSESSTLSLEVAVIVPASLPNYETPNSSKIPSNLKKEISKPLISAEVPSSKLPSNVDQMIEVANMIAKNSIQKVEAADVIPADVSPSSKLPSNVDQMIEVADLIAKNAIHKVEAADVIPEKVASSKLPSNVEQMIEVANMIAKNSIQKVEAVDVIPAEVPSSKLPSNVEQMIEVANMIAKNSIQKVEAADVIPAETLSTNFESPNSSMLPLSLKKEISKPLKNSMQMFEVVYFIPAEIPSTIAEEPSKIQTQVIKPVVPGNEIIVTKKKTHKKKVKKPPVPEDLPQLPSKGQAEVIESVLPVERPTSIVNYLNGNANISPPQVAVQKVDSLPNAFVNALISQAEPAAEKIVSSPNVIVNSHISQSEPVAEKVDQSMSTEIDGQVLPEGMQSIILSALFSNPQAQMPVEKVGTSKPDLNSYQVIELSDQTLPMQVPNSIVNALNVNPQGQTLVEKVGPSKQSLNSNQIFELSGPALPIQVQSTILNALKVNPQGLALVEKVNHLKPSLNSNQVIELSAAAFPNTNSLPMTQGVANKVFYSMPSKKVNKPVGNAQFEKGNLSQSSESVQSSEEDSDSESNESLD